MLCKLQNVLFLFFQAQCQDEIEGSCRILNNKILVAIIISQYFLTNFLKLLGLFFVCRVVPAMISVYENYC